MDMILREAGSVTAQAVRPYVYDRDGKKDKEG